MVAWSLPITGLDPLRFGLLFERFLNPERVSMPDFDIDFCQERREEVIAYVQEKYGRDRVAQIITFGTPAGARGAARRRPGDAAAAGPGRPPGQDGPQQSGQSGHARPGDRDRAAAASRPGEDDEAVAELLDIALQLEGLYRNASTHAAGVVIADRPLTELVPLYRDPRSDLPATQFNMKWVESAGLVKFDFLGLKTLTVHRPRACKLPAHAAAPTSISTTCRSTTQPTYELMASGQTVGVFQMEGQGMRDTLRKLRPASLEEITALISLYRPGPMDIDRRYVDCKFGRRAARRPAPARSKPVLAETYGVIVYQEQVMQIAQILAGYSLGEADLLRRAMGKKKKEEMDQQRARFLAGAAEQRGAAGGTAELHVRPVAKFAGYGFNKSHAAPYALISYQTAWLKANAPVEFFAASMSLDISNTDKLARVLPGRQARRASSIRPPDVNRSERRLRGRGRRGALCAGRRAQRRPGRRWSTWSRCARRAGRSPTCSTSWSASIRAQVNKRALENLARAGAFDAIHPNRAQIVDAADTLIAYAQSIAADRASAQDSLFGDAADAARPAPAQDRAAGVRRRQLDEELAAVGFYLSGHPLDDMIEVLRRHRTTLYRRRAGAGRGRARRPSAWPASCAAARSAPRARQRRKVRLRHPVRPHRRIRGAVPARGAAAPAATCWSRARSIVLQGPRQGRRRRSALLRRRRRAARTGRWNSRGRGAARAPVAPVGGQWTR